MIERVDGDFVPSDLMDGSVGIESRYVQPPARNPADAQAPTSLGAYRRDGAASVAPRLDLRWTPDEIDFVRPAVDVAFRSVLNCEVIETAREYAVADPYAGARAAPVLSAHFNVDLTPDMVTAGAGITGLLHSLAALAQPGPVLHQAGGHPDLPRSAALAGARVHAAEPRADGLLREIAERRPALVLLDRPTVTGEFIDVEFLAALCEEAEAWAATVVVDEAYATYPGPAASCVPLIARHRNLVVLRGMSKGYCCGGLRIGFALADVGVTARLRELTPPLSANSAGLAVALRLLERGDVFGRLRDRIAAVKPIVSAALRAAGLDVAGGAPFLPWVTALAPVRDGDDAARTISDRGLIVKELPLPDHGAGVLLRIALPLSRERLRVFTTLFELPEAP